MSPNSLSDGAGIRGLDALAMPSSLLSSRWSRDNLVTSHPAQLYDGPVLERIETDTLEHLLEDLTHQRGPFQVESARMGVFTWDVVCQRERDRFVLQVPLALDETGQRGRSKRSVPNANFENLRTFIAQGLKRFGVEPLELLTLSRNVPAALFAALPNHCAITFGAGAVRLRAPDGFLIPLGPRGTADVLAEMVAALVYHYEPEVDGGTAITDVFVNDGDFAVRRRSDGALDVRLTAARHREPGIGRNLLLIYLIQMMAYEDFSVDGSLSGLPVLVSNPAVAFEGLVRGLRYRYTDLGRAPEAGVTEARRWVAEFARSREGRAYRPWADAFLDGGLELTFGEDVREHWWRRFPLERKRNLLALRGRVDPLSGAEESAHSLQQFLERLGRDIGRRPEDCGALHFNDLAGEALEALLTEARIDDDARAAVAAQIFAHWPYRGLDPLLGRVPTARALRRFKSRLTFGDAIAPNDEGTLRSLDAPPKAGATRPIANHELFGAHFVPPSLEAAALSTFPTFEAYMDAALHNERFGYYAQRVVIAQVDEGGHFDTHPQELSPRYGEWIATWAYKAWRDLTAHGELGADDPFPLIEFGAGNGRLARDILDSVDRASATAGDLEPWKAFASRLEYRIYEMSPSLRERQSALLRGRGVVGEGDARAPRQALLRDFPNGVRGVVITNEVPDAFGVHKVALSADGSAFAALVVPRIERALADALDPSLVARFSTADASIRETFAPALVSAFTANPSDLYLDHATFEALLLALSHLSIEDRDRRLDSLWFEELYVPASALPSLAQHISENADDYATALAAEDSGVVVYVNLHADRFVRELADSMRAGFILTIDYGETTWGLVQGARRGEFPFRVYGEETPFTPRPNDPYTAPGSQDMTADVNFSALVKAGQRAGLELVHFGPERDIVSADALPALLRVAEREQVAKFLGHPGFKMLALGTRQSSAFSSPYLTALPLWAREQDLPKSRRERRSIIHETLSALRTGQPPP